MSFGLSPIESAPWSIVGQPLLPEVAQDQLSPPPTIKVVQSLLQNKMRAIESEIRLIDSKRMTHDLYCLLLKRNRKVKLLEATQEQVKEIARIKRAERNMPMPALEQVLSEAEKSARYEEMVCRCRPAERKALEEKLDLLPHKEEKIAELCDALRNPHFTEEIFTSSPDLPFYALAAFKEGRIDEYQFGTILLFWSVGKYHEGYRDVKVYSLFNKDASSNGDARKLIYETINQTKKVAILFGPRELHSKFLTDNELDTFMEEMKKLPPSEQHFFIVPDIDEQAQTISRTIRDTTSLNLFARPKKGLRMVPSLGMMQTILRVKFGKQAVKINPVLGLSSLRQMRKVEKRDMALHFPGITLPKEADQFLAPWYDFSYHDFYHAILCSGISLELRHLMIEMADFALQEMKDLGIDRKSPQGQTLRAICTAAIDMEMSMHRRDFQIQFPAPAFLFWYEIEALAAKAFTNPDFEKFDVETALLFLQRAAQKLILDKKGAANGLTKDSLQGASKIPLQPEIFAPEILSHNFLKHMFSAVTNPATKVSLCPAAKIKIDIEKFLIYTTMKIKKEETALLQERVLPFSIAQLSSLSAEEVKELRDHVFAVAVFNALDTSLSDILRYDPQKRDLIFKSLNETAVLLAAGVSLHQIMALEPALREKILENNLLVVLLLKAGMSWEKVCQSDLIGYQREVASLLQMGASLHDVEALSQDDREFLSKNGYTLQSFADAGASYAVLKGDHFALFHTLAADEYGCKELLKAGIRFEELTAMTRGRLKSCLNKSYACVSFAEVGILSDVLQLDDDKCKNALEHHHAIRKLKEAGFTFEQIMATDALIENYYELVGVIRAGASIQTVLHILASEPALFKAFCSYRTVWILELKFPVDWIVKMLRQDPTCLEEYYWLPELLAKGTSKEQLMALPPSELKALLQERA